VGEVSVNGVQGDVINARPSSEVGPGDYETAAGINTDLTPSGDGGNYGSEYSLRGKGDEGSKANNNEGDNAPFHSAGTSVGGDVSINIANGDVITAQPSTKAMLDTYVVATGINTNLDPSGGVFGNHDSLEGIGSITTQLQENEVSASGKAGTGNSEGNDDDNAQPEHDLSQDGGRGVSIAQNYGNGIPNANVTPQPPHTAGSVQQLQIEGTAETFNEGSLTPQPQQVVTTDALANKLWSVIFSTAANTLGYSTMAMMSSVNEDWKQLWA
jgi:hypothetical protein